MSRLTGKTVLPTSPRAAVHRFALIAALATCPVAAMAAPLAAFTLDPRGTIHLTNDDPDAQFPLAISLTSLGLSAGDPITLTALGDFSYFDGGADDVLSFLFAVFSSTDTVLAASNLNRCNSCYFI